MSKSISSDSLDRFASKLEQQKRALSGPIINPLVSSGPQTKLIYRAFNPAAPCTDPSDTIIYQTDPGFPEGMHVCQAGSYQPLTLGPVARDISCRLQFTANQSMPTALTMVTWDVENSDTDTMHDAVVSPERITIRTAGRYLVHASIWFQAGGGGAGTFRQMYIGVNGGTPIAGQQVPPVGSPGSTPLQAMSVHGTFSPGDWLFVWVSHDAATNLNLLGTTALSQALAAPQFGATKIG